jgi:hypothetical protein
MVPQRAKKKKLNQKNKKDDAQTLRSRIAFKASANKGTPGTPGVPVNVD